MCQKPTFPQGQPLPEANIYTAVLKAILSICERVYPAR
jgi:hypothetical protein